MSSSLRDLNLKRKGSYRKDAREEEFFLRMNRTLRELEEAQYRDYPIEHPFIFVIGAPRSGTTLVSQLIAACLDVGYINNLAARFWLAPLHGIRLSKAVLGREKRISFSSDYARTEDIRDIHEFGYFWRDLLRKETLEDITQLKERSRQIDWPRVRRILAAIQHEFGKPMVFKNIFGSYHLKEMSDLLEKVIYVYIERDPLDSAISILEARRKHYRDLNTWWSYTPPEYDLLKDKAYWEQIAGQIYFLKRFYDRQIAEHQLGNVLRVHYRDLCQQPAQVLAELDRLSRQLYRRPLEIAIDPPAQFPFRSYTDRDEEKQNFARYLKKFEEKYGSENH